MADSMSDADKIRNKRLAKLQNNSESSKQTSAAESSATPAPSAPSTEKSESINAKPAPSKINISPSPWPSANPFPGNPAEKPVNISVAAPSSKRPRVQSSQGRETMRDWEDRILGSIFQVTLDPHAERGANSGPFKYLEGVRSELEEQAAPIKLNIGILDVAIVEASSNLKGMTPLEYLLGCWKRTSRLVKPIKSPEDPKLEVLKEVKRLCLSYCIFAVTIPDMFGIDPPQSNPLVEHFLVDPDDDRGISQDFLLEATSRFAEDESIKDAMVDAAEALSRQLGSLTLNDDYKRYVMVLQRFCRYPAFVIAITESPNFCPNNIAPQEIETKTFLGPFFQISPLQGPVVMQYFAEPKSRSSEYINNAQRSIRMSLTTHQTDLLDIVNLFIRASKEARERTLDWFAYIINTNHKRLALQLDIKTVASDGFMINITTCLDQLCEPFMDAQFTKVDKIDVDYLRRRPRVSIAEETKLNADQKKADKFYGKEAEGVSNFISEIFFLTLAAHHYGTGTVITRLGQLDKDIKHYEKELAKLEADRTKWLNTPQFPQYERALKQFKNQVDKAIALRLSKQGVLFDDLTQQRSMQFMRYVVVWILRIASGSAYPKEPIILPLAEEKPPVFDTLPEYFLENAIGLFKFVFASMQHIITSTQCDELVTLCITLLRSSEYIKNPHLKAGVTSILFYGIWPAQGRPKGALGDLLTGMPFANQHLMHALMNFYIECENMGTHTQFFDKFNIRYEIFQIIKTIWVNTLYRERLLQESKVNVDFFIRFVNLLTNDVTFVLDEALTALEKVNTLTAELENKNLDEQTRTQKDELLAQSKGQAKSYMQLVNETVEMLKLFTETLADSFTMPEIVGRLAAMLDFNLDALTGEKSAKLRVENATQYGFQPKALLSEIVTVYLNLHRKQAFVEAVARDGRSYKPENFKKAAYLLSKFVLKSPQEIATWDAFAENVRLAKEADEEEDMELGEVPDEFLDPLMYTLMKDPVILPTSKVTIDRATIMEHLLSDPLDPFNRVPLKIEDVVPNTELKAQIEAFKAKMKAQSKPPAEPMDTDLG